MSRETMFTSLLDELDRGRRLPVEPPPPRRRERKKVDKVVPQFRRGLVMGLSDDAHLDFTGLLPATRNALWNYEKINTVGQLRQFVLDYGAEGLLVIPGIKFIGVQHIYYVTGVRQ